MAEKHAADASTEDLCDEPDRKAAKIDADSASNGLDPSAGDTESSGDVAAKATSNDPGSRLDDEASLLEAAKALGVINRAPSQSGTVLYCGCTEPAEVLQKKKPKGRDPALLNLYGPRRLHALADVPIHSIFSHCSAFHCIAIATDGTVYTWGRNQKGQLGRADKSNANIPTPVSFQVNVVQASCSKLHSLFLTDMGQVYAAGDNSKGALGIGSSSVKELFEPKAIDYSGLPIRRTACGAEFSVMIDIRGNLYSFGCPEYGQLGSGTDGQYFVTANKLAFACQQSPLKVTSFVEKDVEGRVVPATGPVKIKDICCGSNHGVALDEQGRVFTWGFGGYGRLGHNEQKDEHTPRLLKYFNRPNAPNFYITQIYAGGTCTLGVDSMGCLYMWGQTKRTGEANMYPKPVNDLSGWKIHTASCGPTSIAVAADDSLVTWGPSPTYGELMSLPASTLKQEWAAFAQDYKTNGLAVFTKMFKKYPSYQKLFEAFGPKSWEALSGNVRLMCHAQYVMKNIGYAVQLADNQAAIDAHLKKVGGEHVERKVTAEHFKNIWPIVVDQVAVCNHGKVTKSAWDQFANYCNQQLAEGLKTPRSYGPTPCEEAIMEVFQQWDVAAHGKPKGALSARDLQTIMGNLQEHMSLPQIQAMIAEADTNKDGMIQYDEFLQVFRAQRA